MNIRHNANHYSLDSYHNDRASNALTASFGPRFRDPAYEGPQWMAISFVYQGDEEWLALITRPDGTHDEVEFMAPSDSGRDFLEDEAREFWLEQLAEDGAPY